MHGSAKTAVFGLVLTLSFVVSGQAGCPVGDLYADCEVGWADVQILAEDWLESSGGGSEADLDGAGGVNMADFAMLADNWRAAGEGADHSTHSVPLQYSMNRSSFTSGASPPPVRCHQYLSSTPLSPDRSITLDSTPSSPLG